MLNKSVFIGIQNLVPCTFDDAILFREVLETMVCCQISKTLLDRGYDHRDDNIIVCYNYDPYGVDLCINNVLNYKLTCCDEIELRKINAIVNSTVEEAIEEFYVHHQYDPNAVLNFNSCLINRSNFIVSIELLCKRR